MHSGHEWPAVYARVELAMKPKFQEKCSYTMAVQVLLGGGSVRRLKYFAVIYEVGRRGVSMVVAAFASSLMAKLPGMSS